MIWNRVDTHKTKSKFFRCHGCGKLIRINQDNPRNRKFEWTHTKSKVVHNYCYDCDELSTFAASIYLDGESVVQYLTDALNILKQGKL